MKKLNLSKVTLVVLSILFLFSSCEKELSPESDGLIKNSKAWYLKSQEKTRAAFNGNYKVNITKKELWEDAKVYALEGGSEVVGVPLDVRRSSGIDAKGDFMLFIAKVNGEFISTIAFDKEEGFFKGPLTTAEVLSIYEAARVKIKAHDNKVASSQRKALGSAPGKKVMGVPGDPTNPGNNCIDWYWTVYALDDQGNPLYIISEQYLYTTCDDDDGGDGEDPIDPEEQPPVLPPLGSPVSIDGESEITLDTDTFKVFKKWWTYCDGITFRLQSRERLAVRINNGIRTWASIDHLEFSKIGFWAGGSFEFVKQSCQTEIIGDAATAYVKYQLKYTPLARFELMEFNGDDETSYAAWDVYFAKK